VLSFGHQYQTGDILLNERRDKLCADAGVCCCGVNGTIIKKDDFALRVVLRQIQNVVSRAKQQRITGHFERVVIRIVERPIRVETKRLFHLTPVPAYGIGGHFAFLPIDGQEQAAFPYLGCQKNVKALAFQFQAQTLQMGELAQGSGNVIQRLGLAFRRRITPTGIGLQGSQVF
jgi:hypothetical protein